MASRNTYEPLPPPDTSPGSMWAMAEFARLAEVLNGGVPRLVLAPQAVAPDKPREGMVANANGTNWNPGGGAGLYQRLGGAWVKL